MLHISLIFLKGLSPKLFGYPGLAARLDISRFRGVIVFPIEKITQGCFYQFKSGDQSLPNVLQNLHGFLCLLRLFAV